MWWKQSDIVPDTACRIYIDGSEKLAAGAPSSHGQEWTLGAATLSPTEERRFMFGDVIVTGEFATNSILFEDQYLNKIQMTTTF